jgi:hypothetical protein
MPGPWARLLLTNKEVCYGFRKSLTNIIANCGNKRNNNNYIETSGRTKHKTHRNNNEQKDTSEKPQQIHPIRKHRNRQGQQHSKTHMNKTHRHINEEP